jgi:hypothetical protein
MIWYIATIFLYLHNNYFVLRNKLNSSMSNFGGTLSQPKKIKFILGISLFLPTKFNRWWILPRKYNRQRRQLLFLVCLKVSEKRGVMK